MQNAGSATASTLEPDGTTLTWSTGITHVAVARLNARLVLGLGGGRGCTTTPACDVRVWAEQASGPQIELASCQGLLLCKTDICAHVIWLGRSAGQAVHECVRARRCVPVADTDEVKQHDLFQELGMRTVAEAMLGITLAILQSFGACSVELQSMDNGSGKLNKFYSGLGFVESARQPEKGDVLWMEAPIASVAPDLTPTVWLRKLVPCGFDAPTWLHEGVQQLWLERARVGKLPRMEFPASFPPLAQVRMQLCKCVGLENRNNCLALETYLSNKIGTELAHCRSVIDLERKSLTVLWLGRYLTRTVHPTVRGRPAYLTPCTDNRNAEKGDCTSGGSTPSTATGGSSPIGTLVSQRDGVTCAVALLGLAAAVARWFGVAVVELRALDDGSGKLVRYLQGIGFMENFADSSPWVNASSSNPQLTMSCRALARRCCPTDWSTHLSTAEDLNRWSPPLPLKRLEEVDVHTINGGSFGEKLAGLKAPQQAPWQSDLPSNRRRRPRSGVRQLAPLTSPQIALSQTYPGIEVEPPGLHDEQRPVKFDQHHEEKLLQMQRQFEPRGFKSPKNEMLQPLAVVHSSSCTELSKSKSTPAFQSSSHLSAADGLAPPPPAAKRNPQAACVPLLTSKVPRGGGGRGNGARSGKSGSDPLSSFKEILQKRREEMDR